MQTGTATFFLGNIPLTQVRGPNSTNSSGSYDASLAIDFGARTLHFVVNNVVYIFNGGANQTFAYDNAGVGTGTRYATDKGNVQGTDDALNKTGNFTPPPPRQTVPRSTSQARSATTRMPVRSRRGHLSP